MKIALQAFDDFTPQAAQIRAVALNQDFGPQEYQGHTYTGISNAFDPSPVLKPLIEQTFGPIDIRISFFRLGVAGDRTTSFIHADVSVEDSEYAGILYLTDPTPGLGAQGTAFWRHRELDSDRTPAIADGRDRWAAWVNSHKDQLNSEANDLEKWEQLGVVPMRFNRFVAYPTNFFHSRWPRDSRGDTNATGRLIWVVFFNHAAPLNVDLVAK